MTDLHPGQEPLDTPEDDTLDIDRALKDWNDSYMDPARREAQINQEKIIAYQTAATVVRCKTIDDLKQIAGFTSIKDIYDWIASVARNTSPLTTASLAHLYVTLQEIEYSTEMAEYDPVEVMAFPDGDINTLHQTIDLLGLVIGDQMGNILKESNSVDELLNFLPLRLFPKKSNEVLINSLFQYNFETGILLLDRLLQHSRQHPDFNRSDELHDLLFHIIDTSIGACMGASMSVGTLPASGTYLEMVDTLVKRSQEPQNVLIHSMTEETSIEVLRKYLLFFKTLDDGDLSIQKIYKARLILFLNNANLISIKSTDIIRQLLNVRGLSSDDVDTLLNTLSLKLLLGRSNAQTPLAKAS